MTPGDLQSLAAAIDAEPDLLHNPHTRATWRLIGHGHAALSAVAPLLSAAQPLTRQRAWLVVNTVLAREGDWTPDAPPPFDPLDGDDARRAAAARVWQAWIAARR